MIQNWDLVELADMDQLVRNQFILGAGCRVTWWVVVYRDDFIGIG